MRNNEKEIKVCAVIVTYGDRFHLLKKVIESCFREKFNKIIIIDNASAKNSRNQLKKFERENKDILKVIYLDENTGSAGGYNRGLKEAYECNKCEYILTLDDDNIIENDFLKKAKGLLNYLSKYKNDIMLGCCRCSREWDRKVIHEGWVKSYKPNNFMGFNFWDKVLSKFKKIITNKQQNSNKSKLLYPLQSAQVTAMGGLFFHKSIINKIGLPREDFYLYADDHEYTFRFTKSGGKIFMCSELMIRDIDQSNLNSNNEKIGLFNKEFPELKFYYTVRNHTYLSKLFIRNKVFFFGNLFVASLLYFKNMYKIPFTLFVRRYKLYLKAIKDGIRGNLGKRF